MKTMRKLAAPLLTGLLTLAIGFSMAAAAAPPETPFASEDLEGATGNFILVRDHDRIPDTLEGAETFAFPYEGGDKQLKIARKSDSATKDYVIEGDQSLYFTNVGENAAAAIEPLITKGNVGTPLNFQPSKVYVARFLFKEIHTIAGTSTLNVNVRTWSWEDEQQWVNFEIKPKSSGGFTARKISGGGPYDKIVIQQVEEDVYEVAMRFSGLQPSADQYCYLFWQLNGQGGVSIDGFKAYESKENPNKFFERAAYGADEPDDTTKAPEDNKTTAPTKAPGGDNTTAPTKAPGGDNTTAPTKAPGGDNTTAPTEAQPGDSTADPTATGETDLTEAPTTATTQDGTAPSADATEPVDGPPQEGGGLSGLALGILVAAIVVVIGCGAAVAAFLIIKKKKSDV